MKRYRIPLSRVFPATHPRKGEPTCFEEKIRCSTCIHRNIDGLRIGMCCNNCEYYYTDSPKLHTIRENVEYWKKRIDEINAGDAVLEVYEWTGKPYCSPAKTLFVFDQHSGIDYQEVIFNHANIEDCTEAVIYEDGYSCGYNISTLAKNDGLSLKDFKDWFKKSDLSRPKIIIHFANFRY